MLQINIFSFILVAYQKKQEPVRELIKKTLIDMKIPGITGSSIFVSFNPEEQMRKEPPRVIICEATFFENFHTTQEIVQEIVARIANTVQFFFPDYTVRFTLSTHDNVFLGHVIREPQPSSKTDEKWRVFREI